MKLTNNQKTESEYQERFLVKTWESKKGVF